MIPDVKPKEPEKWHRWWFDHIHQQQYTSQISDHKLKHLLAENGARVSIHRRRRQVTHVVLVKSCDGSTTGSGTGSGARGGLAVFKIKKETGKVGGCGVKYVGVEWHVLWLIYFPYLSLFSHFISSSASSYFFQFKDLAGFCLRHSTRLGKREEPNTALAEAFHMPVSYYNAGLIFIAGFLNALKQVNIYQRPDSRNFKVAVKGQKSVYDLFKTSGN